MGSLTISWNNNDTADDATIMGTINGKAVKARPIAP